MTLPVIISTAEEALRAVPQAFRTVSISVGATRWQTIRRIVLKEALPGILTGVILGLERAAGETAPILFTGAAFFLPRLPLPFGAAMALPPVRHSTSPEMPIQIRYGTAWSSRLRIGMNLTAPLSGPGESRRQVTRSLSKTCLQYADGTVSQRTGILPTRSRSFGPAGQQVHAVALSQSPQRLTESAPRAHPDDGENILDPKTDVIALRRKVGMVFARPVPLPMSIRENITYGLELAGEKRRSKLDEAVERSLKLAAIWDEVEDRLNEPAVALSGGQQQRICLARVLALQPEIILLDEPTSGLDPISTGKVEMALQELKKNYTVIMSRTPSNRQAAPPTTQRSFAGRTGGVPTWAGNFTTQRQADGGLRHG
jgi:energy-coupling factor transporter ATP-binding protein EcfA2